MAPGSRQILVLVVVLVAAMFVERQRDPRNNIDQLVQDYQLLAEQTDPSIEGDTTAGLQWTRADVDPPLRVLAHDGEQFVGVGVSSGGATGRDLWLLTSADGTAWERSIVDVGDVHTVGTVTNVQATAALIAVQFQAFDPKPGRAVRDSIRTLVAASDDGGASWVVSEPSAPDAPDAPHTTYEPIAGEIAVHETDLYALASLYAEVDVRAIVEAEHRDAAACIFSSTECPPDMSLLDARTQLLDADLPAATIEALQSDWMSALLWSPDLGVTWQSVGDLPVDGLSSLTAGREAVVVATGIDEYVDAFFAGTAAAGFTEIDRPADFDTGWVEASGGTVVAFGFDEDGTSSLAALSNGSWVPFVGPGSREYFVQPALGPLGQVMTLLTTREIDGLFISGYTMAFRPSGGQWKEGPPLRDAPDLTRLDFTVGTGSIIALAWPDYDPDAANDYEERLELMTVVDGTRDDYYAAIASLQPREAWILVPVSG